MARGGVGSPNVQMGLATPGFGFEPIETVRKFFPETWIWQLSEVGLVN